MLDVYTLKKGEIRHFLAFGEDVKIVAYGVWDSHKISAVYVRNAESGEDFGVGFRSPYIKERLKEINEEIDKKGRFYI